MAKKRICSAIVFVLFLAILSGCETCKLTARGLGQGITQGLPQDARDTWQTINRADDWVKKNLW